MVNGVADSIASKVIVIIVIGGWSREHDETYLVKEPCTKYNLDKIIYY